MSAVRWDGLDPATRASIDAQPVDARRLTQRTCGCDAQLDRRVWLCGKSLTLHRIADGWRINAGCRHWEAPTVAEVCSLVLANVVAGPEEWADHDEATRRRWAAQVTAAVAYLAVSVVDR